MIWPTPRHRGQVCETWKNPRELIDLAAPAAGRTVDGARAGFRAGAVAFVASVELADFDLLFHAEGRFLERDLHVVAKIGTALPIFTCAAAAAEKRFEYSAAAAAPPNTSRKISNGS